MLSKCIVCGKGFESERNKKFCSHACYYHWRSTEKKKYTTKPCKYCGKKFKPKSMKVDFCSNSCASAYSKEMRRFNTLREVILKRDNYKCVECGKTENLHIHHIDGSGSKPIPNNNPDNLVTLCELCHKKKHVTYGFTVNCLICGKSFHTTHYKQSLGKGKYCSKECFNIGQTGKSKPKPITKQITVNCVICGKEFPTTQVRLDAGRGRYCSKACLYEANKSNPGRPIKSQVKVNCQVCGKEFIVVKSNLESGRGKYCSRECYNKKRKTS